MTRRRVPRGFGPEPSDVAEQALDDVAPADPESVARAIALRRLTAAPQTRAQLAEALARRGVPDDVAERVLDRFTEVSLVDDAAYAEAWVTSRVAGRGLARRALRAELARRGVGAADVEAALERLDPAAEEAAARALVERRLGSTRGLEHDVRVRRLTGMLARKGHAPGVAMRVVRDALRAEGDADDDAAGDND